MRLVMIEWVDAFGCSPSWEDLDGLCQPSPITCKSVGWLYSDGPDCKVIVPHVAQPGENNNSQGCGDMTIPVSCISKITDLVESLQEHAIKK